MSKGLITALIVIGGLVLIVLMFVGWGSGVYDNAVGAQEEVNEKWSNVQAAYQRRADLIAAHAHRRYGKRPEFAHLHLLFLLQFCCSRPGYLGSGIA